MHACMYACTHVCVIVLFFGMIRVRKITYRKKADTAYIIGNMSHAVSFECRMD